ncbi:hypothetical protein BDU57DRAFT_475905 [Ampelomyces quisqualis]|uniref:Structural maintenance of chromosomes protein 5 n=1 Tax=Ampelomyces quisqualis TaxID=50730 RepID=A0A6A5QNM7_AMPQU|nr:hypothetical protein BDU57DRAFT_475905 [Ampelomyces quisqualis]
MPGLLQQGRKRASLVVSDDEDENEASDHSSTTASSKRARHARDASDTPLRANGQRRHNDNGHLPGEEQFMPGTLVRVKLTNFVTYTAAEFHLGPSLNMIIGPNGTGKSTLVCAICLGLGWSSEHLGRAKEIGLFVKNGSDEAEIEIELAAAPGMTTNPVVRRLIRKSDGKTIFWINNKQSSKAAVLALCKQFSIQIDNLCQFLPQDRVVEFAKMSDVDRLRETQRAAAPRQMVEWHDQLKALRTEEKALETKQHAEKRHLEGLERQQNADREDVERFHQREGLVQKRNCLDKVRPIIELSVLKNEANQAKQNLLLAKRELEQINAEVEPVREAQDAVEAYKTQIENVVKLRKNRLDLIKAQADKVFAKIEKERLSIDKFTAEISGEVKSRKDRERDITRTNADIQRLERQQQSQPVEYDAESFERRKAELSAKIRSASNQVAECEAERTDVKAQVAALNDENRLVLAQRRSLETQSGKQLGILRRISRDTAEAWDWFQKNRNALELQGEVHGPPILECSLRDTCYADAVETLLRNGDLLAITCTHRADQKLLSDLFQKKDKLGLHDVHLRTAPKPLSDYRPPVPTAELHAMGFEGFMIDYIQGPDPVLAMLCENQRLNRIAYSARPLSGEQHDAVSGSSIQKWISGRELSHITTRREYGASSTSVSQLRAAKYFVDQPANAEETRQLDEAVKRIQQRSAKLQETVSRCKQETVECRQRMQDFQQQKSEVQAEQDQIRKALAEWNAMPDKIQRKREDLDRLKRENSETSSRIRAIKVDSQRTSLSIAALTVEYAKSVTQLRTFHEALVEAEIRLIEAKAEFNALKNENSSILEKLKRKEAEIQDLDKRNTGLRIQYRRLAQSTQQDLNRLSPEEMEMVLEYRQLPSLEALELECQAVTARLEMMAEGNSGVIRAFEKRKEDIKKTQEKLEDHNANLERIKTDIKNIREHWEPQLDALIAKISDAFAHNFEQIGCAGEVEVYKDEDDFDRWSIQISVRFREGETMAVLNSYRQSGGERAVSTIFYLMALQDLAQSPFRVVDEINQGMDPRNERMVHERMVDIACQERTSQYFLVTPKLLTGLKFHPKMKVHIINSGEHIPDAKEAKGTWNMREFAKIALRTRKEVHVA